MNAPREISAEVYQSQCGERLRESFHTILIERDRERDQFTVNWRCWDVFRTLHPDVCFPIATLDAVAQKCAVHGYRLRELLPPTKQQKAYKKLQGLCQRTQSALWSGRITWLGLATGEELLRVSELYAWDHQTILCSVKTAPSARYFLVPAGFSFRMRMAQPEPFMLRVLADPKMAVVLS